MRRPGNAAKAAVGVALALLTSGCMGLGAAPGDAEPRIPADFARNTFVAGDLEHAHQAEGFDYGTPPPEAFAACLMANVREDIGRVSIGGIGITPDGTKIEILLAETKPGGAYGDTGIARNITTDGSEVFGNAVIPTTQAALAVSGYAALYVDGSQFPEVDEDQEGFANNFTALFLVARDGFRDATTGMVLASDGQTPFDPSRPDDAQRTRGTLEAHLIVKSKDDTNLPGSSAVRFTNYTSEGPLGSLGINSNYRTNHDFANLAYRGDAEFSVTVNTRAPDLADTRLLFEFMGPWDAPIANLTLGGGAGQTQTETVAFPLDSWGGYRIRVSGELFLADYAIDGVLNAPEELSFSWWWEHLYERGYAYAYGPGCVGQIDSADRFEPTRTLFMVPQPPGYVHEYLLVSIAAGLLAVALVSKLAMDQFRTSEFTKKYRRR